MHYDIALAGLVVGFVIGLTGMGGGALMTPVLVLLFHVDPGAAISSDVVASVVLKPIGGGVHAKRGTVNYRLVRWLMLGSVPSAFLGAYLISRIGGEDAATHIKEILGTVLLVAAAAMVVKFVVQARRRTMPTGEMMPPKLVRPIPTLLIGVFGGLVVGLTSVGSGSLMIVLLLLLYPVLSSREMVGTDLVQAIPLVASAALGHLVFGHVSFVTTSSVLLGAIPGVFLGAQISSRASDRYIRPVLVAVLTISSLKLLNVSNAVLLGVTVGLLVLAVICFSTRTVVRRRRVEPTPALARA
jgi:uncharacterized membrane protein YfcA